MKFLTTCLASIIAIVHCSAQTSSWTLDIEGDDIVYNCIELNNSDMPVCVAQSTDLATGEPSTFLILLDSTATPDTVRVPGIKGPNDIYLDNATASNIIIGVNKSNDSILSIFRWTAPKEFHLISSVVLSGKITFLRPIRKFNERYYVMGKVYAGDLYEDVVLIEFDSLSDTDPYIYMFDLGKLPLTFAFDIIPYKQQSYLLAFLGYFADPSTFSNDLVIVDSMFATINGSKIKERILGISQFHRANGKLFFTGRHRDHDSSNPIAKENIVIGIIDTITDTTMQLHFTHFGSKDTSDLEAFNNLSGSGSDLFVGGTSYYKEPFATQDGDFVVAKYDLQLDQVWEKYFGIQETYDVLWVVKSTSDGGCLLAGTTYDYINKTEQDRDLLFYKLDADGRLITGDQGVPTKQLALQVFPNPASNGVFVEVSENGHGQFRLFNVMGQQVGSWDISGRSRISVNSLPANIYYYQFEADNGTLATGELIILN